MKVCKLSDLRKATNEFSQDSLLGRGRSGKVFLGWVEENTLAPTKQDVGIAVAIKRLYEISSTGNAILMTKVNILGQLAHPNIIRLLGCCTHENERLLVYEYMPNNSLSRLRLLWGRRLLIMIGVARGLTYLHLTKQIIHGDLNPNNILLDEDFNAKLGDLELAECKPDYHTTRIRGTVGYLDPEYFNAGYLTTKSDIYSFGVVLLESIYGQRAFDVHRLEENMNLVDLVTRDGRDVKKFMDPRLDHNYLQQGAIECFELALRCVDIKRKDRPSSEEVLQSLEEIYALYK
ncbi:putative protein kinase RLK-Pelle-RLCK-VIIa-2 family [Helianthus annuus]|nr:putative protein kinase RLK-Pelle-RLCK-VIIa-2 family [Helianthus annuus]